MFYERTKHVGIKYHFIRNEIEDGEVEVLKIHTLKNPADMLTKCIPVNKFESALGYLKLVRGKVKIFLRRLNPSKCKFS